MTVSRSLAVICFAAVLLAPVSRAWYGHETSASGVALRIAEIADVTAPAEPTPVAVSLTNGTPGPLRGRIELRDFVDGWRASGPSSAAVDLPAGETGRYEFSIVSGPPVYTALYPVHAYADLRTEAGAPVALHAVRIFAAAAAGEDQALHEPPELTVNVLQPDSAMPLWLMGTQRMAWCYYDGDLVYRGPGWTGSDPVSRASLNVGTYLRGDRRAAVNMHPPWKPGGGSVFCEYRVRLPRQRPIRLHFATAIRDSQGDEPLSDGVLFRVRVAERDGESGTTLFERFSAAKVWEDGVADLGAFSGRTVTVRLESHPGPARNTTCDSSYWARPVLVAGKGDGAAAAQPKALPEDAAAWALAVASGQAAPDGQQTFRLGDDGGAVIYPGTKGLLDGWVVLAAAGKTVAFNGIQVGIDDLPVHTVPCAFALRGVRAERRGGKTLFIHDLAYGGETFPLTVALHADRRGLRVSVACPGPRRLTLIQPGPWSREARRVFYGHGYCIEAPEPFRAYFGGHNLSSSHVAAEFSGGPAVLQAVDNPPKAFAVDPASRTYALSTHMNATMTFVPGATAFDCAVAYRPLYDKEPAPAVSRLAGRFCFDIWGGRYADIAERMATAVRYGLTDAFLTLHVWQRWGYDYRLPDVWPPNPAYGTVDEMRRIGQVCRRTDIPWGLHDNYIDFYPDARDYTYEHIYFTRDGRPHPAWYNRGRDAQSYKWRPDRIMPFIQRNCRLIRDGVQPTHSFLDVFTSAGCIDYWDSEGNFHSSLETRRHWGEAFAWIRDCFGGDAPTTSEAGHDQLIGYLDGADCQWLTLSPDARKHVIRLRCGDWERVPWYDAVNHERFILHGVGYSGRYQGGRSRLVHGINSDDYISAEILSGHALMVDARCWGRPAVRKYYLAQDVARRLAGQSIATVRFADGDMHRQHVTWSDGTEVWVNRGEAPWTVQGHRLPTFGFLVRDDDHEVALDMVDGVVREMSRGPSGWFVNARITSMEERRQFPITPSIERFEDQGDGRFSWFLAWDAQRGTHSDMRAFVHFCGKGGAGSEEIMFQDDHTPSLPTSQWNGRVQYKRTVSVPSNVPAGEYRAVVGLYDENGRATLAGPSLGSGRYALGTITLERDGEVVTAVRFRPPEELPLPDGKLLLNPRGTMVDAGFAVTDGAFRVSRTEAGLRLVPLPDSLPFRARLRLSELGLPAGAVVRRVRAEPLEDPAGRSDHPFDLRDGEVHLQHDGTSFAYDLDVR